MSNFTAREAIVLVMADGQWRTAQQIHEARSVKQGIQTPPCLVTTLQVLASLEEEMFIISTRGKPVPLPIKYSFVPARSKAAMSS